MKKIIYSIILILFCFPKLVSSQSQSIKLGTEIPTQYALGYEDRFHEGFAVHGQIGFLFYPYDKMMLSLFEGYGADRNMVAVLEANFETGMIIEFGANYFFSKQTRKNYAGPFCQWVNLFKSNIPDYVINDAFDVDLNTYPIGPIPKSMSDEPLTLSSHFLQVGLLVGRRFSFYKKPDIELHVELALSKNVYSNSVLASDYRYLGGLIDDVNITLKDFYKKYALIPSLNIYFIYKLNYQKF